MTKQINKNLQHLIACEHDGVNGCLEGSSRSGKTWSGIDFLIYYASHHKGSVINIARETYNSFKTTLYLDLARRLPMYGINCPFGIIKDIQQYNLLGSQVNFLGADNPEKFQGAGCDLFWCNEMLEVPRIIFDHLEQRCRHMWFGDWNPKYTDHWVFGLEKRDDVRFLRTTFMDNPHISMPERRKIQSYEPTEKNIQAGTADEFMWKVYGLGERASLAGLVFPNVHWIDAFPDECERITYGMDFGHTNSPTAIIKTGLVGNDLYVEYLFYAPCDNPITLTEVLDKILNGRHIWADSAEPVLISALRARGNSVLGAVKKQGSIMDGITIIKSYRLHVVRSAESQREFNNYKYREIRGFTLNEPIDDFNHGIDALRYAVTMELKS